MEQNLCKLVTAATCRGFVSELIRNCSCFSCFYFQGWTIWLISRWGSGGLVRAGWREQNEWYGLKMGKNQTPRTPCNLNPEFYNLETISSALCKFNRLSHYAIVSVVSDVTCTMARVASFNEMIIVNGSCSWYIWHSVILLLELCSEIKEFRFEPGP